MNRFGKVVAGLGVLALLGLASITRFVDAPAPAPSSDTATVAPLPAGPLRVPVAGVAPAALTDTFDHARGEGRVHDAIDIMAPRGTPVLAAAAGRIEKLFDSERGGHTLYIRSPDGGWVQYYAHLDHYAAGVHEGLAVAAGQAIAAVGSTGDASAEGPHLHFELKRMAPGDKWYQGRDVNPYPLLAGRPGERAP